MRYVQVKSGVAGFLFGHRFVTRADGPFVVEDDRRAAQMIEAGMVEGCMPPQAVGSEDVMNALFPAPAQAERATAHPSRPQRPPKPARS